MKLKFGIFWGQTTYLHSDFKAYAEGFDDKFKFVYFVDIIIVPMLNDALFT